MESAIYIYIYIYIYIGLSCTYWGILCIISGLNRIEKKRMEATLLFKGIYWGYIGYPP